MSSTYTVSARLQDELAAWFESEQRRHAVPSVVFGVFDRSGVVHSTGWGSIDGSDRGPTADTLYRICSMTKSFCIAAVLKLEEMGRLSIADPVDRHVPEMPPHVDRDRRVMPTIEMLMNNSSGLPEDNRWADFHLDIAREQLIDVLEAGLRYSFVPGEEYQYSNIGFAVLGLVVERVTGEEFETFVQRELIEPLGLTSTGFGADATGSAPDGVAVGWTSFDEGQSWVHRPMMSLGAFSSAGSLFSTVRDVARWSAWLSSAFSGDDSSVLSSTSRRRMQRIHTPKAPVDADVSARTTNFGYGLGLAVEHDQRFGAIAQHSGGMPGFSSNMRWHCSSGLGVVVLANTDGVPASSWATKILQSVLEENQPPARVVTLWPETTDAAAVIDAAVRTGRLPAIDDSYSPNVISDVPVAVRAGRLEAAVSAVGGLSSEQGDLPARYDWCRSPADVAWHIDGASGRLSCRIELTETVPPLIQRLEIVVHTPDADHEAGSALFNRPVSP